MADKAAGEELWNAYATYLQRFMADVERISDKHGLTETRTAQLLDRFCGNDLGDYWISYVES